MKNSIKISGVAFIKNSQSTAFMKAFDLCEPFKAYGNLIDVGYSLEFEGKKKTIKILKDHIKIGLALAIKEFGTDLIFCHIQSVKQDDVVIENKSIVPFINPEISVVSNGEKFGLVVDHIKHLCPGIKIKEGEIRRIKSVSWSTK